MSIKFERRANAMLNMNGYLKGLLITVMVGASMVLAACGSDDEGTGSLEVRLSDMSTVAPGLSALAAASELHVTGVEAITVTFSRVEVHSSANAGNNDAGWHEVLDRSISEVERTFDLLLVASGNFEVLGLTTLAAGTYQQVRIVIEDATITMNNVQLPLAISSGSQSGLKLNHTFTVVDGQPTILTLDFDAEQSLKEEPSGSGNFSLKPVIGVVQL